MSEKDARVATIPFSGVKQDNHQPSGKVVVAEAVKIHAPIEGDRIAYRQTMEAYELAIKDLQLKGEAPMNPNDIIRAAEHRGDPMATVEADASILKSVVGIKDYPDGSFMGVFNDGQRMMISGQLESPEFTQHELTSGSTQVIPTQNGLVPTDQTSVKTVDVVKGIMISSEKPAVLSEPDHDRQLETNPFLLKKAT